MEDDNKIEEQMIQDINENCIENEEFVEVIGDDVETIDDEEPEVQTTFTDFAIEEMIDEEGSVENVSY